MNSAYRLKEYHISEIQSQEENERFFWKRVVSMPWWRL